MLLDGCGGFPGGAKNFEEAFDTGKEAILAGHGWVLSSSAHM